MHCNSKKMCSSKRERDFMCGFARAHGLTSMAEFGFWRALDRLDSERNTASNWSNSGAMVSLKPAAISLANILPLNDTNALFVVALPGDISNPAHPRLQPSKYFLHSVSYNPWSPWARRISRNSLPARVKSSKDWREENQRMESCVNLSRSFRARWTNARFWLAGMVGGTAICHRPRFYLMFC
jgi:hypothetical protein